MRRLLVLLSLFLALAIFASSNVLAERPSAEYRLPSIVAMFRTSVFPFFGSFFYVTQGEIIGTGGGASFILGGDADDYGNGRVPSGGTIINPDLLLKSRASRVYDDQERNRVNPLCE